MGNLAKEIKETLPQFQKFLLERKLASEKYISFLAHWVSRSLRDLLPGRLPPNAAPSQRKA
jgi:hypothetical protein